MKTSICFLAALGSASAFVTPFVGTQVSTPLTTTQHDITLNMKMDLNKAAATALAAATVFGSLVAPSLAITRDQIDSLSYTQVKGTGLANRCPEVVGDSSINVSAGKKKLVDLCIEPKQFQVLEEVAKSKGESVKDFVNTKLMTRQTYTLYGVEGPIGVEDGKLTFKEKDGIDYAATTVQLPGGERVPFLFTVKGLVAKSTNSNGTIKPGTQFGGPFKVPSYRTGLFLDPKGRGGSTGYDMAVALPGKQSGVEGDAELFKENNKTFDVTDGAIEFEVNKVDQEAGEIGGVFVSKQKGDTDMGSKTAKDILIKGIFYGKIQDQ